MIRIQKTYGDTVVEATGETNKEAFTHLADMIGILAAGCGLCKSKIIIPVSRQGKTKDGRTFDCFEWKCLSCQAVLPLGVHQEGNRLFRRSYIEDGQGNRDYSTKGWRQIQRKGGGGDVNGDADGERGRDETEGDA